MEVGIGKGRLAAAGLFLLGWLPLLTSCMATAPATQGPAGDAKPSVFRSEDYVVVDLKGGETPSMLAERFLGDANRYWVIEDANEGAPFRKSQRIVIPLKEENIGGLSADGYQTVPILCYHQFGDRCESNLCMPADVFDRQMKYLKDNGYRVITFGQLRDFLQYRRAIPKKAVLITIDDGYRSVYTHAYPVLRKYGYPATLFIYTDFIGVGRVALNWEQLRELKSVGFEIGSHSISHSDLTKIRKNETKKGYYERIKKELAFSKEIIDKKLNQETRVFAFPYGRYNQTVIGLTREAGYETAVSVKRGGNPFFSEPLALRRDQILGRDMKTFESRLNTFYELSLR